MKLYLRLLRYLWPHRKLSALSFLVMILYAVLDGVSWIMFVPFLRLLFGETPRGGEAAGGENPRASDSLDRLADLGAGPAGSAARESSGGVLHVLAALKEDALQLLTRESRMETLTVVCLAILLIFLLKALVNYAQLVLPRLVEERTASDLRNELFEHLHRLSFPFFQRIRSGKVTNVVASDIGRIKPIFSLGVHRLAQKALEVLVAFGILLAISWRLTLLTMLVIPPLLQLTTRIARRMRVYNREAMALFADLISRVQENIFAMRVINAFNAERREVRRFRAEDLHYYRIRLKANRYGVIGTPLSEFLVAGGVVLVLWYGGYLVLVERSVAPEMFFLFLALTVKLNGPLKFLSQFNESIQPALAASERLFGLLDSVPEVREPPDPVRISAFMDRIVYDDVSFSYGDLSPLPPALTSERAAGALPEAEAPPVLRGISLEIRRGEVVALVGPSGAGKSTIVDLLPRFYDPSGGRILLDGIDLRCLALSDLRGLLALVTQETLLFHDSVRNNIAYAKPDASQAAIVAAARAANAEEFIDALPQGFDTMLGERGLRLSGGERQRIAIARALLKNPPILILDEATSSLDSTSERLVQEALSRLMRDRTTIVIAHRLSTVRHASRILVVAAGRIVEEGTHAELLRRNGLYRQLYETQFEDVAFEPEKDRVRLSRSTGVETVPHAS